MLRCESERLGINFVFVSVFFKILKILNQLGNFYNLA